MKTSDFDYELPQELIAQTPIEPRDHSRLLVYDRADHSVQHLHFYDLPRFLNPGDVMVVNDTRVIPARLLGEKEETHVPVEIRLLKRLEKDLWEALVRPGRRLAPGTWCSFGDGLLRAEIVDRAPEGARLVRFHYQGVFEEILDQLGQMPLPPYIKEELQDGERYQTVYSKVVGSAAAPTAGLHFTPELLENVQAMGVKLAYVTLHVGLGTFRPVKVDDVEAHDMHAEFCAIPQETADLVNQTKANGGRIICVGTTSCRTIESAADENGVLHPFSGETDIFIYPSYRFKVMDALITNFHLPESTLLMLVSAFGGYEHMMQAYRIAVAEGYRFFSFGDAMFIS